MNVQLLLVSLECLARTFSSRSHSTVASLTRVASTVDGVELLTRWRIIAEVGAPPEASEVAVLGKTGAEDALKKWHFLSDYVVTDQKAR